MTTQEAVKAIKEVVASGKAGDPESLRGYAEAHATACAQVMEKAFFCDKLLKENKRAEALSLAKRAPDLKTEYELVDFEAVTQWWTLCESSDLPRCHLVIPDTIIRTIKDIYSANPEFDALLRKHRLLALSRGSIRERLSVIRKLAALDANSAIWKKDVVVFEKACLEELQREVARADRSGDLAALESSCQYLEESAWQNPQTATLLVNLRNLIVPHKVKAVTRNYQDLAGLIGSAHERMDETDMVALTSQWRRLGTKTGILPDAGLVERTASAFAWIQEIIDARQRELDYQQGCEALERFVGEPGGDLAELDELAATVLSYELGFPELLALRYNTKRKELEKKAKIRFATQLTGVIALLILLAAGAGFFIDRHVLNQNIKKWETTLTAGLDQGLSDSLVNLFVELEKYPRILHTPEIQDLQSRYQVLVHQEERRVSQLAECLDTLDRGQYSAFLFEQADKLARSAEEKARIESHRQIFLKNEDEAQRLLNDKYQKWLAELEKDFQAIKALPVDDMQVIASRINHCKNSADQIVQGPKVYNHLAARAGGIKKACDEYLGLTQVSLARENALREIAQNYHSPSAARALIEKYLSDYSNDPYSVDFKAGLDQYALAETLIQWQAVRKQMGRELWITNAKRVDELYPLVKRYCDSCPKALNGRATQAYLDYLTRMKKACDGDRLACYDALETVFNYPLLTNVKSVTTEGKTYFVLGSYAITTLEGQKKPGEKTVPLDYYYNSTGGAKTLSAPWADIRNTLQEAPHSQLCQALRDQMIRSANKTDVDPSSEFHNSIKTIIQSDASDPILRASLLRLFLGHLRDTQPVPNDTLDRVLRRIDDIDLDVAWMDPDNVEANTIRPLAKGVLDAVRPYLGDELVRELEAKRSDLYRELEAYQPIGIVMNHALKGMTDYSPYHNAPWWRIVTNDAGASSLQEVKLPGDKTRAGAIRDLPSGVIIFVNAADAAVWSQS